MPHRVIDKRAGSADPNKMIGATIKWLVFGLGGLVAILLVGSGISSCANRQKVQEDVARLELQRKNGPFYITAPVNGWSQSVILNGRHICPDCLNYLGTPYGPLEAKTQDGRIYLFENGNCYLEYANSKFYGKSRLSMSQEGVDSYMFRSRAALPIHLSVRLEN